MKRTWLVVGAASVIAGLLAAVFVIPALAQGEQVAGSGNGDAWQEMHQACQNGDWDAMAQAAANAGCGNYQTGGGGQGMMGLRGGSTGPAGASSGRSYAGMMGGSYGDGMMGGSYGSGMMAW